MSDIQRMRVSQQIIHFETCHEEIFLETLNYHITNVNCQKHFYVCTKSIKMNTTHLFIKVEEFVLLT